MKKIITILSLLLITKLANAQYVLLGKWEVFCPMETPLRFCEICSTEKHEKMGTIVYGFAMDFSKDTLHIINAGTTSRKVSYTWQEKTKTLRFSYLNKNYTFQLLNCGQITNLILKEQNGLLLVLNKVPIKKDYFTPGSD